MNSETGQILPPLEVKGLDTVTRAKFFQIDERLMTEKQRQNLQVSKRDNRSPLGKLRFKTFNNLRNKPCPVCSSGKKFKKCCWNKVMGG